MFLAVAAPTVKIRQNSENVSIYLWLTEGKSYWYQRQRLGKDKEEVRVRREICRLCWYTSTISCVLTTRGFICLLAWFVFGCWSIASGNQGTETCFQGSDLTRGIWFSGGFYAALQTTLQKTIQMVLISASFAIDGL